MKTKNTNKHIIVLLIMTFVISTSHAQMKNDGLFKLSQPWTRLDSAITADIKPLPFKEDYKEIKKIMKKTSQNMEKALQVYAKEKNHPPKIRTYSHDFVYWYAMAESEFIFAKAYYDSMCKKIGKVPYKENYIDKNPFLADLYGFSKKWEVPSHLE